MLAKLHTNTKTPTPPNSSYGSRSSQWVLKIPHNIRQLERQITVIKRYLQRRTTSPPSPIKQVLDQLIKGCEMAMHNAIFLANENVALRAANQKKRQKQTKKVLSVSQGGALTVQEGRDRTLNAQNEVIAIEAKVNSRVKTRAPPRCSICRSYEHTARVCAQRSSII